MPVGFFLFIYFSKNGVKVQKRGIAFSQNSCLGTFCASSHCILWLCVLAERERYSVREHKSCRPRQRWVDERDEFLSPSVHLQVIQMAPLAGMRHLVNEWRSKMKIDTFFSHHVRCGDLVGETITRGSSFAGMPCNRSRGYRIVVCRGRRHLEQTGEISGIAGRSHARRQNAVCTNELWLALMNRYAAVPGDLSDMETA